MSKEVLAENIVVVALIFLKILKFIHMSIDWAIIPLEWLLIIWLVFFDIPKRLNNSLKTRIFRTDLLFRFGLLATTLGLFIFLTSTGDFPTILPWIVIDKVVALICFLTLVFVSILFFSRRISRYTRTEIPLVYKAFFVEDLTRSANRYIMGFSLTIVSLLLSFGLLLLLFLDILLLIFLFLLLLTNLRHPLSVYNFWTKIDTELLWGLAARYKPLTISNFVSAGLLVFNLIAITSFIIVWGENYGLLFIILSGGWYVVLVLFQITRRSLYVPLYLRRGINKKEIPTLPPRCDFCITLFLLWAVVNILIPLFVPAYLLLDLPFEWVLVIFVLILFFSLFINATCIETIVEWKKQKNKKKVTKARKGQLTGSYCTIDVEQI